MKQTHEKHVQDDDSIERLGSELSNALAADLIARTQRPAARHLLCQLSSLGPNSGSGRLERVEQTLMHLREDTQIPYSEDSAQHVFTTHFEQMCASLGFRRGLASTVVAGTWRPTCLYIEDHLSGTETDLRVFLDETVIALTDAPLEADSIRRRRPQLVSSPKTHTQTFKPLMLVSDSPGYVVAPVNSRTEIVGMVHADQFDSPATQWTGRRSQPSPECSDWLRSARAANDG